MKHSVNTGSKLRGSHDPDQLESESASPTVCPPRTTRITQFPGEISDFLFIKMKMGWVSEVTVESRDDKSPEIVVNWCEGGIRIGRGEGLIKNENGPNRNRCRLSSRTVRCVI